MRKTVGNNTLRSAALRHAVAVPLTALLAGSPALAATMVWDNGTTAGDIGGGDNVIKNTVNFKPNSQPTSANEGLIDNSLTVVAPTLYFGGSGTYGLFTLNSATLNSILASNTDPGTPTTYSVRLNGTAAAGATTPTTVLAVGNAVTQNITIADSPNVTTSLQLGQADSVIDVANAAGSLTISSKLLHAGGLTAPGLTKTGAGTLTLTNGGNTFGGTGGTVRISGGTLSIDASAELGNSANTVTLNGGTLQLKPTAALNLTRGIIVNSTGGTIETAGALMTATNVTLSNYSGSGTLTKTGGARLILGSTTATAFNGGVIIKAGSVQVKNTTALSSASVVKLDGALADNPTLDLRSDSSSNFGTNVEATSYGQIFVGPTNTGTNQTHTIGAVTIDSNATLFANGSAGYGLKTGTVTLQGNGTFSSAVAVSMASISDAGTSSFTKGNTGMMTINGVSGQNGATTVLAGTLKLASGASMPNTTGVDVRSGATLDVADAGGLSLASGRSLQGAGRVVGNLSLGGTVDAGTAGTVGTLTADGELTLNSGSLTTFDIASPTSFDLITQDATAHNVTLGGAIQASFAGDGYADGQTFKVLNFATYASTSGLSFGYSGLSEGLSANFDATNGTITLSAVPEPAALALAGMAGLLSARRRRRA